MKNENPEIVDLIELREKLTVSAEVLVSFYDKDCKAYLKEFSGLISKHSDFNKLKRFWGAEWDNENKMYLWQLELRSLTGDIAAEYYSNLKKWLQNPEIKTYPELNLLINQRIKEIISEQKKINRYEWIGERSKAKYEEQGKDFIEESHASSLPMPPSPQDKKESKAIEEIVRQSKLLRKFCKNIKSAGGIKMLPLIKEFENHLFSDYKEKPKEFLGNILQAKSVYQLAKEKEMSYRKLLYNLRSIGFRMSERNSGRLGWYIPYEDLPFFEEIFPLIKNMFKARKNHNAWINLLKKQKGWEKSHIALFMKRRIERKIVPSFFFNLSPDNFPPEFILRIINKDRDIIKLFGELKSIFGQEPCSHQQIKEMLRELCLMRFPSSFSAALKRA
jgi:hypothetical protein